MQTNVNPELMGDYQTAYNDYWKRPDRFGQSSFKDVDALSTQVIKLCGSESILDVGCGMGELVRDLLGKGIDAYGIDISDYAIEANQHLIPDRFKTGSILEIPWKSETFNTIICTDVLEHLREEDISLAIKELYRVSKRFVFCTVSTELDRDKRWHLTVKDKKWWEEQFFHAGFRKHPLFMTQFPYESLENDRGSITLVFEKIPEEAKRQFSMKDLLAERDLHMDMLRESGRRSDAHIARYVAALKYIRPHDVVVDVASGMGYGSAILWDGSLAQKVIGVDNSPFSIAYSSVNYTPHRPGLTYIQADAHHLDFLSPASVDVFVSMETIEHLEDPKVFLEQVKKILRPGGRIILSVPNNWTDETGEDPNPYHLHVFDRRKIVEVVQKFFCIEQVFGQIAGGGMRLTNSPRIWFESNDAHEERDAEWWIVVAMKKPVTKEEPYTETVQWKKEVYLDAKPYQYKDSYEYPWIQHAMVTMGLRANSTKLIHTIAEKVMEHTSSASPDMGAALCVLGYQVLESRVLDKEELESMINKLSRYINNQPHTPMETRWAISCSYLLGQLYLKCGKRKEAVSAFEKCIEFDFLRYAPTLATKAVGAAIQIGIILMNEREIDEARKWFKKAVSEAERAFSSSWSDWYGMIDEPLTFGLKEASQILDLASQATYALWLTADGKYIRPNVTQSIIDFSESSKIKWLEKSLDLKEKSFRTFQSNIEHVLYEKNKWIGQLEEGKQWLENKVSEMQHEIEHRDKVIAELKDWIAQLEESKGWLEKKLNGRNKLKG